VSGDKAVSLVRCDDYDPEEVLAGVRESVRLLGGLDRHVAKGQKVLLKPNLLRAAAPERCVTPHPAVVRATGIMLLDHGCEVILADSPGAGQPYTEAGLRKVYAATGMDKVAEELGIELNFDTTYRDVPNSDGRKVKRFSVIGPALDADSIVSVCKAKTHVMTAMTGAVKNLFGLLPGWEKPSFHSRMESTGDFAAMLVDLSELMRPRLSLMDAIMAIEGGGGPNNGSPRRIGAIITSADVHALDVVEARLISYEPLDICTIREAVERGHLQSDLGDVRTVGARVEELSVMDFRKPATFVPGRDYEQGRLIRTIGKLARAYALRPEVITERCIGCGGCVEAFPKRAVRVVKGMARFSYSECIRCYCCHEACPHDAIALRRSVSGRMFARMAGGRARQECPYYDK
jgi:uncharacterized protein (DUF362 family)/Pyruvate/2-oxoacid:ferredoxin oxidoreductase delta subunit